MTTRKQAQTVTFTVEGGGPFPIDMLRYDACYPASENDSFAMLMTLFPPDGPAFHKVTLRHRVMKDENINSFPTEGRWNSFTWIVVPSSVSYDR